jgi:Ca2+-binding EF-hand superfamily protein
MLAPQEAARIAEMYEKHDTDKSGGLHEGQLKAFMQEYVQTLPGHASKVVTDAEAHYVMSIADTMHDGEVEKRDITEAIAVSRKRALACTSSSCFLRVLFSGPRRHLIHNGPCADLAGAAG